ncbi:GntR family transcriptional regulator, partial [Oleiphilus sp. HI0050]
LIEVRPKSGYYVKAIALSAPVEHLSKDHIHNSVSDCGPDEVTTSELIMDVLASSAEPNNVSFGAAVPASDFPIIEQLKKSFANLVRTEKFLGIGYDSGKGCPQLRKQLARRASDAGMLVSPDEIIITAGCQGAIVLCLRSLCEKGDVVAVESPGYYGLLQLIESLGLKALEIPSDPVRGMSIDALQLAVEQWPVKVVLSVPSYSNPMGALMPETAKLKLAKLLEKYDLPMIEDDIYGELSYSDARPKAVKSYDKDGRILLCSSVSKVLDPQLCVGWVMPGRYREKIEYQRFLSNSSHFALPQLAVADILSRGRFDRHLRHAREVYSQRRDRLLDLIALHFPKETRITKPQGGFVAWIQLPDGVDSTEFYHLAKAEGVIVAPGEIFSTDSSKYHNYIRLSYAHEWTREREQAVVILGNILKAELSRFT